MACLRLLLLALLACGCSAQSLTVQNVERKINLNSQLSKVVESLTVKNTGSKPTSEVVIGHLEALSPRLASLKVKLGKQELQLADRSPSGAPASALFKAVKLLSPLAAGATVQLDVYATYTAAQVPYPATVAQTQAQLTVFTHTLQLVSPYSVATQTTEVSLPDRSIKSFTSTKAKQSSGRITYGPFQKTAPFAFEELRVHYENQHPFKQMTRAVREIQVSHWGNIYVEETYEVRNAGALHRGAFSRLAYVRTPGGRGNSFKELSASLPPTANSLYYVDLIGNISSSNVRRGAKRTTVDIELRYPLMGGWTADFTLGYSLPLAGFLFSSGAKRQLRIDFATPFSDVYVDELVTKVVLPEGSSAITFQLPFDVAVGADTKYTYLDTVGRPVLVLTKRNVVPEHNVKLVVDYSFHPLALLHEPALLIAAFSLLFLAAIAYNRMDFSITKEATKLSGKQPAVPKGASVATPVRKKEVDVKAEDRGTSSANRAIVLLKELVGLLLKMDKLLQGPGPTADATKAALDTEGKELDSKIRAQARALDALSPGQAASYREAADKGKALIGRYLKALGPPPKKGGASKHLAAISALQGESTQFDKEVKELAAAY